MQISSHLALVHYSGPLRLKELLTRVICFSHSFPALAYVLLLLAFLHLARWRFDPILPFHDRDSTAPDVTGKTNSIRKGLGNKRMCRHAATNCSLSLVAAISFSCVTLAQAVAIKRTVMTGQHNEILISTSLARIEFWLCHDSRNASNGPVDRETP